VSHSADQDIGSLSIPVPVQEIGANGHPVSYAADAEARTELADRFGLRDVSELTLEGRLKEESDGSYTFRGTISAKVVQTCVVTLDPVENEVEEPISLRFVSEERLEAPAREVMVDAEEEEETEPLPGDVIDLGEAVAEQFGVALDPYPRKPGAVMTPGRDQDDTGPGNPFAVLRNLGRRG